MHECDLGPPISNSTEEHHQQMVLETVARRIGPCLAVTESLRHMMVGCQLVQAGVVCSSTQWRRS